MSESKTYGEKVVRTSFNPSDDSTVQHIKERAAEFINYVNMMMHRDDITMEDISKDRALADNLNELHRLKQKAIDRIEEAAMYAVKAATVGL
jgi:tRNA uridine 5-carbamoylmethylation protein Kti12